MANEVGIIYGVLGIILGVFCGSIPSGLWIVKSLHGIDIRNYGSKNIGATNVFRTVGIRTAIFVLIADALKGIIAVSITNYFFQNAVFDVLTALGALLGHNYSIFLKFKGGKGVATGLGLLIFLMPMVGLFDFIVWLILVLLTRYVSLGSVIAALCTPIFAYYFAYPVPYIIFGAIAGFFVIVRHKENIKRLLNGTESKIKPGNAKNIQK